MTAALPRVFRCLAVIDQRMRQCLEIVLAPHRGMAPVGAISQRLTGELGKPGAAEHI